MDPAASISPRGLFRAVERPEIPPLAWLFSFDEDEPTLYHGSGVDLFARGFFEGCFAGEFGSDPRQAANVFGSGMWHADEAWHVVTPSHTLEAVWVLAAHCARGVSNSLPFLVEHFTLDVPRLLDYGRTFGSIVHGIDACERDVFSTASGSVSRHVHFNILIDGSGRITERDKPAVPPFLCYEDYVAYLRRVIEQSLANAGAPDRAMRHTPLGTMSSGYDSACATALAREFGCQEAVTIWQARGGGNDSGKPIGDALGIEVHEYERPNPAMADFDALAEFFASGMAGEDFHYTAFSDRLRARVLITGSNGGVAWSRMEAVTRTMARSDTDGASHQEHRLRTGFLHLPVPSIGLRNQPQIRAITDSDEMAAYDLESHYSSPIPRRVLETMGVPRRTFGQTKSATMMFYDMGMRRVSRSTSRQSLGPRTIRRIVDRGRQLGLDANAPAFRIRVATWHVRHMWIELVARIEERFGRMNPSTRAELGYRSYVHAYNHPMSSLMFLVSLDKVRERYAIRDHNPVRVHAR